MPSKKGNIMSWFHKHSWSIFTCNADEIPGIQMIGAVDIHTKEKKYLKGFTEKVRCNQHSYSEYYFDSNGNCPSYGCSNKLQLLHPQLKDILITYKKCATCDRYEIVAQDSRFIYSFNKEYVKLKIELLKKQKDDSEIERLLNIGNPDYKPSGINEIVKTNKEYESIIEEQKKTISQLQSHLRVVIGKFNDSLKNDGIWEALPQKVKKELITKYGKNAGTYEPMVLEQFVKVPS